MLKNDQSYLSLSWQSKFTEQELLQRYISPEFRPSIIDVDYTDDFLLDHPYIGDGGLYMVAEDTQWIFLFWVEGHSETFSGRIDVLRGDQSIPMPEKVGNEIISLLRKHHS